MHRQLPPDDPLVVVCLAAKHMLGGPRQLAEKIGLKRNAVAMWSVVPERWVLPVERETGISRYKLRPDIFGAAEDMVITNDFGLAARVAVKSLEFAEALGVPLTEIAAWDKVPPEMVLKVEKVTGVSRHKLRPDVFGDALGGVAA